MGKRGKRTVITPLNIQSWWLYNKGFSYQRIADELNISLDCIRGYILKGARLGYISRRGNVHDYTVDSPQKIRRNKFYYRLIQVCWMYEQGYTYQSMANYYNTSIYDIGHYLRRGAKHGIIKRRNKAGQKGRKRIPTRKIVLDYLSQIHYIDEDLRPFSASAIGMSQTLGRARPTIFSVLRCLYEEGLVYRKKTWTKPNPTKKAHLYTYRIKK